MMMSILPRMALLFSLLASVFLPASAAASLSPNGTRSVTTLPAHCRSDNHGLFLIGSAGTGAARFQALQLINSKEGKAAGNGFLIETADGGCTWKTKYTGPYSFSQLQFFDSLTGYALAQAETGQPVKLLRTEDGGTSFHPAGNTKAPFERFHFISPKTGFGYAANSAFQTTDAGQTWTSLNLPPHTDQANFNTLLQGWAITSEATGYEVMFTQDGGQSWKRNLRVKSETVVGGEIYSDNTQVWILLYGGSGMSQTSYSVFHSKDQGLHWKQIISNATAGGGPAPGKATDSLPGPFGHPYGMQLTGKAAFLAAGSGATDNISFGRTLDNGDSWSNREGPAGNEAAISFYSPQLGWMIANSAEESALYTTSDSGTTWSKIFSMSLHTDRE